MKKKGEEKSILIVFKSKYGVYIYNVWEWQNLNNLISTIQLNI